MKFFFFQVSIIIILLFIFKNIVILFSNWFILRLKQRLLSKNSKEVFNQIINLDYEDFNKLNQSEILYKIINEISRVSSFIFAYVLVFKEILLITMLLIPLFISNYMVSISSFLFLLTFVLILIFFLRRQLRKVAQKINKHSSKMIQGVSDVTTNFMIIKLSNKFEFFLNRYINQLNLMTYQKNIRGILEVLPRITMEIVGVIGLVSFSLFIFMNDLNLQNYESLLVFTALAFIRIIPAFANLNLNLNNIFFNEETFNNFLNNDLKKDQKKSEVKIFSESEKKSLQRELKFNFHNVFFKYKDQNDYILKEINVEFNENYLIGLTGRSGSGKSTLTKLITGFLKPTKGKILVNNIASFADSKEWTKLIGYVPQKIILSNTSIKKNIAMGFDENQIDLKKIFEVIKKPFINEIIKKENIEFKVLEDGNNLSGGQIQSIGLARALYNDPKIIIMDEPTNNLDIKTKKIFMDQVQNIKQGKLIFLISHDEELLKKCNKIYVLKDQSLIEVTHDTDLGETI